MSIVDQKRFSETVGMVYDAALDANEWPKALENLCAYIGASMGTLNVVNPADRSMRLAVDWGCDPHWINLLYTKYMAIMPLWPAFQKVSLDKAYNTADLIDLLEPGQREGILDSPFFKEWAEPVGLRDIATATVWREPTRGGVFSLHTPDKRGNVTEAELEIFSLFIPHVKRAVMIGDIFNQRAITPSIFENTLNSLGHAAFVVNDSAQIQFTNDLGKKLLAQQSVVTSTRGVLEPVDRIARKALAQALNQATKDESKLGFFGIGIPFGKFDDAAMAYLMPLARRTSLQGLNRQAEAIVVVKTQSIGPPTTAEALIAMFGLTQAEAETALAVCRTQTREAAAEALGVSLATVKTHIGRVFAKTATTEKAELAVLLLRLQRPSTE